MVSDEGDAGRRCAAAHRDDASPCEGEREAVRIVVGEDEVLGCVHHGARLYASVDRPRVYPCGGPDGPNAAAADEVCRRAVGMRPFFWMAGTERRERAESARARRHARAR